MVTGQGPARAAASSPLPSNTTELVPDVDGRFPRLAASNAEGAFDVEHEPEQDLEQEARAGASSGWSDCSTGPGVPQPAVTGASSKTGRWCASWTNASTGAPLGTSKYERTAEAVCQ